LTFQGHVSRDERGHVTLTFESDRLSLVQSAKIKAEVH